MKQSILLILLFTLASCASLPEGDPLSPVDSSQLTIFYNGSVITMEEELVGDAIAIRGESIEAVGSSAEILQLQEDSSTLIDLQGLTLMPGFVDAHTHILNDHRSNGMSLDEAQSLALKNGITSLATLYVDESFLKEIQSFNEAEYLRVRTSLYLVATDACGKKLSAWWKKFPPTHQSGEMLEIAGIKIFTDGGSCGKVALSFELEPGEGLGDLWFTQEEMNNLVKDVHSAGYQAAVHAIGDRAIAQALDAIEIALDEGPNELRHRMEHVAVIPAEQISRFGKLGITPVLNGEFPSCSPFGPPIPEEYNDMEWPWRDLRSENPELPIAWHSDYPFLSGNPFVHLLGFVTRIDAQGPMICPPGEWMQDDTLSVEEALSMMTIQSAYALFRDDEVGSLAPGKKADLIVVSVNPLTAESDQLSRISVLLTMVGGRTEYCRSTDSELCPDFSNRIPAPLPDTRPPVPLRWLGAVIPFSIPIVAIFNRKSRWLVQRQVAGVAGIVAGVMWLFLSLSPGMIDQVSMLLAMSVPAFLFSLALANIAISQSNGKLGKFGLGLSLFGTITLAEGGIAIEWFMSEFGWGLLMLGIITHGLGMLLFGLSKLRSRNVSVLAKIPFFSGLLGVLVIFGVSFFSTSDADFSNLLFAFIGIGWILIGWSIRRGLYESSASIDA